MRHRYPKILVTFRQTLDTPMAGGIGPGGLAGQISPVAHVSPKYMTVQPDLRPGHRVGPVHPAPRPKSSRDSP